MNTKTILNIKTEKKVKEAAQRTAEKIGVPLSTVMNAFLKQFIVDQSVTFSVPTHKPSEYLIGLVEEARKEYLVGDFFGPFGSAEEMIKSLKS